MVEQLHPIPEEVLKKSIPKPEVIAMPNQEQRNVESNREPEQLLAPIEKNKIEVPILSVEDAEVSKEVREKATEGGLIAMREVMKDIDDVVIFASTAMYLHGRQFNIEELQAIPGDFDAAVQKEETLNEIRDRLARVPGVFFDNNGKYKKIGEDECKVLSGRIHVAVETQPGVVQPVEYPFEFFQNSRMVNNVADERTKIAGMNVLNLDGLQGQYLNNLKFESQVGQRADEVMNFLNNETIRQKFTRELAAARQSEDGEVFEPSVALMETLKKLSLTPDKLEEYYKVLQTADLATTEQQKNESKKDQIAILTGGLKDKSAKRLVNIEKIKKLK